MTDEPTIRSGDTDDAWEDMLGDFRALGGVADNVDRRIGTAGFGLFARDTDQDVRLQVPPTLLIPIDQIEFVGGAAVVRPGGTVGAREAQFFARYQARYSWGGEGGESAAQYIAGMQALPAAAVRMLKAEFHTPAPPQDETPATRFLSSRAIRIDGVQYAMPVIELINHAPGGIRFDKTAGVAVCGRFAGEIRTRYRVADAWRMFTGWGFASPEPHAFSLPLAIDIGGRLGVVYRGVSAPAVRQALAGPKIVTRGHAIEIPCLLLGDAAAPGRARAMFGSAMTQAGMPDADRVFDRTLAINIDRFSRLAAILDGNAEPTAVGLRDTCAYQLQVLEGEAA